jgi:isopentenyl-diphosphate delta-isomerase
VDDRDQAVGTITRDKIVDATSIGGYNLRAAHVFIENSDGRLFVPRRTAKKKLFPNALDFAAAEHVRSGEDYLTAAVRGMEEELNLTVDPDELALIVKTGPTPEIPYFRIIFLYHTDTVPDYNPLDFSGYEWLRAEIVLGRIAAGEQAKPALTVDLNAYLEYRRQHPRNEDGDQ